MPELTFQVEKAEPLLFAAAPAVVFKIDIRNKPEGEPIHSILLRCQVRIEPARRSYHNDEPARLSELFGERGRWGQTMRGMLWTNVSIVVPSFVGSTVADLPVPCPFDFNVAATKYFDALEGGEVPLVFLFSGAVFHESEERGLQVAPIPWSSESSFRLPVSVWKEMMEHYHPNSAWLCLRKDVFDRLNRYRVDLGLTSWEDALERLLSPGAEP
jgi:hypothetical protein